MSWVGPIITESVRGDRRGVYHNDHKPTLLLLEAADHRSQLKNHISKLEALHLKIDLNVIEYTRAKVLDQLKWMFVITYVKWLLVDGQDDSNMCYSSMVEVFVEV